MEFDDVEIDLERFELRLAGAPVSVEPKVFDLIRYLAENANRLVSKDELIETVWEGRIVSDSALSSAIKSARRAMGEADVAKSRIKTVRGRGFRMELPDVAPGKAPKADPVPSAFVAPSFSALSPRDLPHGLSGETFQRRLCAAMARVPFLIVVAPPVLRGLQDLTPGQLAESVGQGYALDTSGRPDGGIDCLLFDTVTGATVWSFEAEPLPKSGALDTAISEIAIRLEPQLVRAIQTALAKNTPMTDPRAMTMQALGTMAMKGWNRRAFDEAETGLREAVTLDPSLAYARAALALIMGLGERLGLVEPEDTRRAEAIDHADQALELDGMTPNILGLAGCALVDAGQALRGKAILERALSVDPLNSQALAALGAAKVTEREFQEGRELLARAIRISPHDSRLAIWRSIHATALLMIGEADTALVEAERAVAADDRTHLSRVVLAAIHLSKGNEHAAREAWKDARRITPDLTELSVAAVIGKRMAPSLIALSDT